MTRDLQKPPEKRPLKAFDMAGVDAFSAKMMAAKTYLYAHPDEQATFDCPRCGGKVEVTLGMPEHCVRAVCQSKGCLGMEQR